MTFAAVLPLVVTRALVLAALGAVLLGNAGSFAGGPCPDARLLPAPSPESLAALATRDVAWAQPSSHAEPSACGGKIRPGAQLVIDHATLCTADWVFRDAQGALYLGTAGHCLPPGPHRVDVPGAAQDIGQVAFTVSQGVGEDFALLRIRPELASLVDPTLCHWAGPVGAAAPGHDAVVESYGWGPPYSALDATRARVGALPAAGWGAALTWAGTTAPGDSGMPLMDADGMALGLHTHTSGAVNVPEQGTGVKFGTRLDHALELVHDAGLDVRLATGQAPRLLG